MTYELRAELERLEGRPEMRPGAVVPLDVQTLTILAGAFRKAVALARRQQEVIEGLCWFDWSSSDSDAYAAILRQRAIAATKEQTP